MIKHHFITRCVVNASLLSMLASQPGLAAALTFPDAPPYRTDPVNLAISVDDSGSMDFETMFDTNDATLFWGNLKSPIINSYYDSNGKLLYADNNDNLTAVKKHGYLFPLVKNSSDGITNDRSSHYVIPPLPAFAFARSPDYNSMYYDPRKTYKPWTAYHNGSQLVSFTDATPSAARAHPTKASDPALTLDLTRVIQNNTEKASYSTTTIKKGTSGKVDCDRMNDYSGCNGKTGEINVTAPANTDLKINYTYYAYGFDAESGMKINCGIPNNFPGCASKTTGFATVDKKTTIAMEYTPATFWLVETCTYTEESLDCAKGPDGKTLKRYDITQFSGSSFTVPASKTDATRQIIKRTKAQELQNFANWFTYYRKRKLLASGAFGDALEASAKFGNIRADVQKMNSPSDVANLKFLNGTDNAQNFRALLKPVYEMGGGGTPTFKSVARMSATFAKAVKNSAAANEKLTCQRYNTMLITDGFASDFGIEATNFPPGDISSANLTKWFGSRPYTNASGGGIQDGSFKNRVTHIASYYYGQYSSQMLTDLGLSGEQPKYVVDADNPDKTYDKNPDPHFNFHALTLGALGTMYGRTGYSDPFVSQPDWVAQTKEREAKAVDDLWHATINARGSMLTASDSVSMTAGMISLLGKMSGKDSRSSFTVSATVMDSTNNVGYMSVFDPGKWSGDLYRKAINTTTGEPEASNVWNAAARLSAAYGTDEIPTSISSSAIFGTLWQERKIVSYNGASAINFTPDSEGVGSDTATFNRPGKTDANDVVNYVRGDRSKEYDGTHNPNGIYPERESLLRDIVNSSPVYVKPGGLFDYTLKYTQTDTSGAYYEQDPGYTTFKTNTAGRKGAVYVGGNGGMMHAFDASTGDELWAYVPNKVWSGLNSLAVMPYLHKYSVDGPIVVGDVDFNNAGTASAAQAAGIPDVTAITPDWRTILVGSLRSGGRGIYALDVSNTNNADFATVRNKVLWEFPNNATSNPDRVGHIFGKPVIAKTAYGWVVIVSSGYNNTTGPGDGKGYVYVLDPQDGSVLKSFEVDSSGTTDEPAQVGNVGVLYENDPAKSALIKYAYATSLKGSVWKLDLSSTTPSEWTASTLMNNIGKPISTAPVAAYVKVGGQKRKMVYVGTGKNIESNDLTSTTNLTAQHYLIGLEDDGGSAINFGSTTQLLEIASGAAVDTTKQTTDVWHASNTALTTTGNDWTKPVGSYRGFFLKLKQGDQIIADMSFYRNLLVFSATAGIDPTDLCADSVSALYVLDARTGTEPNPKYFPGGIAWSRKSLGTGIAGAVTTYRTKGDDGKYRDFATAVPGGKPVTTQLPKIIGGLIRLGWRELLN